jgi:hypothetical protein
MLDSLRDAFREAVKNFRTELNRDAPPESRVHPLPALAREFEGAARRLHELRDELAKVRRESDAERREAMACRRREELAANAGDAETARLAREFGRRHERRGAILEDKGRVLAREIEDREDEVAAMRNRVRELFGADAAGGGVAED